MCISMHSSMCIFIKRYVRREKNFCCEGGKKKVNAWVPELYSSVLLKAVIVCIDINSDD